MFLFLNIHELLIDYCLNRIRNILQLVQYHQNRVDSISELERRLESSGYGVGLKILELITYRNREVGTVVSHRYRINPWFFSIDDIMCLFSYC